jgi:AraC-like DNA-binding protein
MQNETASNAFHPYGNVFRVFNEDQEKKLICQPRQIVAQQSVSQLISLSCDVYLEIQQGIGVLLVSTDPHNAPIEEFGMNRRIHIKPNIYFGFISTTPEMTLNLYTHSDYQMNAVMLREPYIYQPATPHIQIQNILGCYYRTRSPGYNFAGEKHSFFELTYVDTGTLYTEVDGIPYKLEEKQMIIYGPGQFHSQHTSDQAVSYITVMFNMENTSPNLPAKWYSGLIGRVFPYSKKIYNLIKSLLHENTAHTAYSSSLMYCILTETILRILEGSCLQTKTPAASIIRHNYQDALFDQILEYIDKRIYAPLTVADICQHFSLSRSTLQQLFKNTINQSPKKYISDKKLELSCQMLLENRYTVSEIALRLGYSSIHYFSALFTQKYQIPPSEYAKRIY